MESARRAGVARPDSSSTMQKAERRVPPLYPLTRAHEVDRATRWGRHLAAVADSIFAQFGSGPRRSLLAAVAIGATMELGRSWRTLLLMMLLLRPRGAGELRGIANRRH